MTRQHLVDEVLHNVPRDLSTGQPTAPGEGEQASSESQNVKGL